MWKKYINENNNATRRSLHQVKYLYHGEDITKLKGEKLRQHRRNVQMVFQDPSTAFNPKMKVKDIICEPLLNFGLIKKSRKRRSS